MRCPGERAPSILWCGHSSGPGAGKPSARNPRTRAQPLPADRIIMTHFNKGPSYGLSAEVKNKIASKYDHQAEEHLHNWIEEVTGMSIGTNFQLGLKDGIILCELRNKLTAGLSEEGQ
ncbi:hypothetical protein J1605_001603 [Eschrichtius robustus]|uniref:Calponin-homology (CH) domain-containing protein n=1 Tax=Eschrichtius robustus TaxID=9764 RepID=A0AB34I489_ESCRO|nr:hypothetical protein J1605_001603 [Eschrichtius robustus]